MTEQDKKPVVSLPRFFSVRVDTKALCDLLKAKGEDKLTLSMYHEIADTFEQFAENKLDEWAGTILKESMMEWDV